VWPIRRSWFVRQALGSVARVCLALLAVCAVITLLFVAVLGHPLFWSIVGVMFAAVPLAVLLVVASLHARGAVVAGRNRVGVRVLRRWRLIDLGSVRVVRLVPDDPYGPSRRDYGASSVSPIVLPEGLPKGVSTESAIDAESSEPLGDG